MDPLLTKVFTAWQTSRALAKARGYLLPDDDFPDVESFFAEFGGIPADKAFGSLEYTALTADGSKTVLFCFSPELKIGNTVVTALAGRIESEHLALVVLIYFTSISPSAEAMVRDLRARKIGIQPFSLDMMQFDPTAHHLQPTFRVCSADKKAKILAEYGVRADQIPGMRSTDPIARWYGVGKGVLIEIVRKCPTLSSGAGLDGKEISFRIVT